MALNGTKNIQAHKIANGCDHYMMGSTAVWLPCSEPGCWGASMHGHTACSRLDCTRNTGRRDPEALEARLRAAGSSLTTMAIPTEDT